MNLLLCRNIFIDLMNYKKMRNKDYELFEEN